MAYVSDEEYDGEYEDVQAVGQAEGKGNNKVKGEGKDAKAIGKSSGKNKSWQGEARVLPVQVSQVRRGGAQSTVSQGEGQGTQQTRCVWGLTMETSRRPVPKPSKSWANCTFARLKKLRDSVPGKPERNPSTTSRQGWSTRMSSTLGQSTSTSAQDSTCGKNSSPGTLP